MHLINDLLVSMTTQPKQLSPANLQIKRVLHFVGNHLSYGQGGGGSRGWGIADVEDPASNPTSTDVEHEVVHQVAVGVQGLGSNSRGTPRMKKKLFNEACHMYEWIIASCVVTLQLFTHGHYQFPLADAVVYVTTQLAVSTWNEWKQVQSNYHCLALLCFFVRHFGPHGKLKPSRCINGYPVGRES